MIEFLKQQLLHNQFFSAAVVASIIAGLIVWLKKVPFDIYKAIKQRIIYSVTIYQNDPLYDDFEAWFYQTHDNKYRNVEAGVKKSKGDYGTPETSSNSNLSLIYYKQIEGFFVVWYKGSLIFVKKGRDKLDHATDVRSIYFDQYHISTFWGLSSIKNLLKESVEFNYKKQRADSIKIFTHTTYGEWYSYGLINSKKIGNIIIDAELIESIWHHVGVVTYEDEVYYLDPYRENWLKIENAEQLAEQFIDCCMVQRPVHKPTDSFASFDGNYFQYPFLKSQLA